MLSQDYLLRQIERFAQVIAKIAGWKKDGFFAEALEELNAVIKHSGDTRRVMELLDSGKLNSPPLPEDCPPDLISAVADLLWEKAGILKQLENTQETLECNLKCLELLLATLIAERHILKMREEGRAKYIINEIGNDHLPEHLQIMAKKYF